MKRVKTDIAAAAIRDLHIGFLRFGIILIISTNDLVRSFKALFRRVESEMSLPGAISTSDVTIGFRPLAECFAIDAIRTGFMRRADPRPAEICHEKSRTKPTEVLYPCAESR